MVNESSEVWGIGLIRRWGFGIMLIAGVGVLCACDLVITEPRKGDVMRQDLMIELFPKPREGQRRLLRSYTTVAGIENQFRDYELFARAISADAQSRGDDVGEAARDFLEKNRRGVPVSFPLGLPDYIVLVSQSDLQGVLKRERLPNDRSDMDVYRRYYKTTAIESVSQIGFNRLLTVAVVYTSGSAGLLNGYASIEVLRKTAYGWAHEGTLGPMVIH